MKKYFRNFLREVKLQKNWQKGMAFGASSVVVLVFLLYSIGFKSGFGILIDILVVVSVACIGYFILIWILSFIFFIFNRIPIIVLAILSGAVIILFNARSLPRDPYFYLIIGIVSLEMLTGAFIGGINFRDWANLNKFKKSIRITGLIILAITNGLLIFWILMPGSDSHLVDIEVFIPENQINADNPLLAGDNEIITFNYGSGIDGRIPIYGENVEIITGSENITHLVSMDNWKANIREIYWGFDLSSVPLNAQVWMPEGDGPFPIVFIVHGNHNMTEFSEGGYAYLGEHLASRGYIFVSVDQNYLNGYFTGSLKGENDARAWLLLKHVGLWHEWNVDINSPLFEKVDIENIALMGHSRGGEAVSIAAAMNLLELSPNNANNRFNFEYKIKSLIAISPSEGQYKMGGKPIELSDLNYLVIQGSQDADISRFEGLLQYERVSFSDPNSTFFKAALLIDRANHSQFNTIWSPSDRRMPSSLLLNRKPIMPEQEQREILLLYISAFLDVTLKGKNEYRKIFENYQNAGDWLPPYLYINQFQSSGFNSIADFEEDIDVLTATNGDISTFGLLTWKEHGLKLRSGKDMENTVVELAWGDNKYAYYSIKPDSTIQIDRSDSLRFELVDLGEFDGETIDFSIELIDKFGNSAEIKISDYGTLLPQFHAVLTKYPLWESLTYKSETEPILQTFLIQFSEFVKVNNNIMIENLFEIKLKFNLTMNGRILLDGVGIEK